MSTNQYLRQHAKYALVELGVSNIGSGNGYTASVPRNSLIVAAGFITDTAFNSGTTATGTITDGTNVYVNAQDVTSTGIETVAIAQKYLASGGTITFSLAETGTAATAGHAVAYVAYVQLGAGTTIQD